MRRENKLEIKAFLFDLDGTLIQTQIANMKAYNLALINYGLEFSQEEFIKTNGKDSANFLSTSFPNLSNRDIEDIRSVKSSIYKQFFGETTLNRSLMSFIEQFIRTHCIGLVTTGKSQNVNEILDFHKIREKFNFIVTGDDVSKPKPSPEPYLKAIEMTGLPAAQILAFEDSKFGCLSAIDAGLRVINVSGKN